MMVYQSFPDSGSGIMLGNGNVSQGSVEEWLECSSELMVCWQGTVRAFVL